MKLELGYKHTFEIREKTITHPVSNQLRIMFLSDFHFNRYNNNVDELVVAIHRLNPHLILLGGDYADTKSGLQHLDRLLQQISPGRQIAAIAGNHDYFVGIDKITPIMIKHHVQWIEKDAALLHVGNTSISIVGNNFNLAIAPADLSILLMHKPLNFHRYKDRYQLIFAGHLHGCQCVLWQTAQGLYPGRFFYRWNILETASGNCHYLISKGLGDTLPIRYNCKKDIIFVSIEPGSH